MTAQTLFISFESVTLSAYIVAEVSPFKVVSGDTFSILGMSPAVDYNIISSNVFQKIANYSTC